jgi:hypothetical protein
MFNNQDSGLNTSGVDRSLGVVGRENSGGGDALYRVYPCCKKSLDTYLSNICIKLKILQT